MAIDSKTNIEDSAPADYVLRGGVVQTMVSEEDVAQAVAIRGDSIVYVGDDAGAAHYIGDGTSVIELDGQMVTPGFMDGHAHASRIWFDKLYNIDLTGLTTNEEYLEAIREFVDAHPDWESYWGLPFMLNTYIKPDGSNPGPCKEDLDGICSDKPIVIWDVSHHSVWANSKALEMADINAQTPNPSAGVIWRYPDGEPRGYLTDAAVDPLIASVPPVPTTDEMIRKAHERLQEEANSLGVTGFTNMATLADTRVASQMDKEGKLSLRLRNVPMIEPGMMEPEGIVDLLGQYAAYNSNLVTSGTVKFFYDGVTEGATAVMLEPYALAADHGEGWFGGDPVWDRDEFARYVTAMDKAGHQVHVHAIGDGAVRGTLDAFEKAREENGKRDARHTITHLCAVADEDIPRLVDLDIVAAEQFLWMYADALYELEEAFVGRERAQAFYPTRTQMDAGVRIAGASDAPITPYNVLDEIEVGVTRNSPYAGEDHEEHYRWPEQGLTPYQMLKVYTTNVAYENFLDDVVGTVEVGKKADLVVLGENLLTVDHRRIAEVPVLYTFSNGRVVYRAD